MRKLALIGRILLIILYLLVIVIGLAVAILLLCGMKLYCVETGSMEPDYPIGSMVVVERVWFESLNEGDVITYVVSDNTVVTHRVIGIDPEHRLLTTKGDNNIVADASPVSYENVLGRVNFCVPGFGYVFLFLSTRFGKIMLGIAAFGLIGFYIIKRMYYRSLENEEDEDEGKSGTEEQNGTGSADKTDDEPTDKAAGMAAESTDDDQDGLTQMGKLDDATL
jgi:signal peptidase I